MVSTKGRLLVATPPLADPNFDRTVVLMLEHNDDGAFGLVINRPTTTNVAAVVPEWAHHAAWPTVLFAGGPVEEDTVIALARLSGTGPNPTAHPSESEGAEGFLAILGTIGTVDPTRSPDEVPSLERVRFFTGYAGWAAGQLDGELRVGAWIVVDSDPSDAFSAAPDDLWRHVLGRQPGSLGWMSNYPDDPVVN
ncbi:MAG: YqgE/AlgH family protein [Acidimicrobiia bacterium]